MAGKIETQKMVTGNNRQDYYRAILERNPEHEGLFYVGVTTTGVFCRPTCSARKPKIEHCDFFQTAQEALLASFRPCKRCRPLSHPDHVSALVRTLVEAVEANPEKRWERNDFHALSVDASTARRQFKKRFGMTFVEYARARRMGLAMEQIRAGNRIIDAQLSTGYESSSGFRDAFSRIMGAAPASWDGNILKSAWIDTRLGPMVVIADDQALYLVEFVNRRGLEREVERLRAKTKSAIIPGRTGPIHAFERELGRYFAGELQEFTIPVAWVGSPFQRRVWTELKKIPYGATRSYAAIARSIGKPSAYRAVARANGANQLAIVIPCHRVINANGELGGYGGGLTRKEWLIRHEQRGGNR